jgi:hypothetical protein
MGGNKKILRFAQDDMGGNVISSLRSGQVLRRRKPTKDLLIG